MKENRANEGSEPRTGYVIQEDGTIVVYLAAGDIHVSIGAYRQLIQNL